MKFIAKCHYNEDETIYTWFSRLLMMNGTNIKEYFQVEIPKKHINRTNYIQKSLEVFQELSNMNIRDHLDTLSNLSYLKLFSKDETLQIRYLTQKRLWGDFRICPACLNDYLNEGNDIEFRKVDQLPLKKVCTRHNQYLLGFDDLVQLFVKGEEVDYKNPSQAEIDLSLVIENLFEQRDKLNHSILCKALIDQIQDKERLRRVVTHWNSNEAQKLLKQVPEYEILARNGTLSLYDFLLNLKLGDMEVSDEWFVVALFLAFSQASIFNSTIEQITDEDCPLESSKKKLKKLLINKETREIMLDKCQNLYHLSNISNRDEIVDEKFRGIVKRSTNEHYIVESEFVENGEEYARIRHIDCSNISTYSKREFLEGKSRCPYCKGEITEWMLEEMVEEKGSGRYHMTKVNHMMQTYQYFIEDVFVHSIFSVSKAELLNCLENNDWSLLNEKHQIPRGWFFSSQDVNNKSRMIYRGVSK
mgnify:CR=1 FL=1